MARLSFKLLVDINIVNQQKTENQRLEELWRLKPLVMRTDNVLVACVLLYKY